MTKKTYKSGILESVHESAKALHKVGAIDKATLRNFDMACLEVPLRPIRGLSVNRRKH